MKESFQKIEITLMKDEEIGTPADFNKLVIFTSAFRILVEKEPESEEESDGHVNCQALVLKVENAFFPETDDQFFHCSSKDWAEKEVKTGTKIRLIDAPSLVKGLAQLSAICIHEVQKYIDLMISIKRANDQIDRWINGEE